MGNSSSSASTPPALSQSTLGLQNEPEDSSVCHVCSDNNDQYAVQPHVDSISKSPYSPEVALTSTPPAQSALLLTFRTPNEERSIGGSGENKATVATTQCPPCYAYSHSVCPLNRAEVGRAAWAYLHTLAAYYPSQPSNAQQTTMKSFLDTFAQLYPCGYCADRTLEEYDRNPPRVDSQASLSEWLCEVHNEVNERLNKPIFDCKRCDERWKTGPNDGSCR